MPDYLELLQRMMVAFSIGLLIGLERGWHERGAEEGQRVAGLRTFGLIALLGALAALLADLFGGIVLGLAFVALAAMVLVPFATVFGGRRERGITTQIAALLAFALGATAAAGYVQISVTGAVVSALLLGLKPQLHAWVASLEEKEVLGGLKLLLISVVLLPVLPNRDYGPWGALNPYLIWWLVVLIAAIGFVGYFAIKLAGARFGTMLTGIFGGIASSTAASINFARLGHTNERLQPLLAAAIVVASATMFPRLIVLVSVINASLLPLLIPVFGGMTFAAGAMAVWLWREGRSESCETGIQLPNPFELMPALKFAAMLVVIMLVSKAAAEWFGSSGAYGVALISGLADVDAISLSMARLEQQILDRDTAARAIVLATFANTLSKWGLVWFIGGPALARRVGYAFAFTLLTGIVLLLVIPAMA